MYQQQEWEGETPHLVYLGTSTWRDQESSGPAIRRIQNVFIAIYTIYKIHMYFPIVDFHSNQLERMNSAGQPVLFVGALCLCGCWQGNVSMCEAGSYVCVSMCSLAGLQHQNAFLTSQFKEK